MENKIKIYEIANPYWLSDTFVFSKKRMNGMELVCYIKVNHDDKIEEIGCDFSCDHGSGWYTHGNERPTGYDRCGRDQGDRTSG